LEKRWSALWSAGASRPSTAWLYEMKASYAIAFDSVSAAPSG
jgi:hypothetical protein